MPKAISNWIPALCLALSLAHAAHAARWGGSSTSWMESLRAQQSEPQLLAGQVNFNANTGTLSFVNTASALLGKGAEPHTCTAAEAPACGSFSDPQRHKSNFGQLRIVTNPEFSDELQMQAAGFLEGYLTAERIFDYSYNMKAWLNGETNDSFAIGDWLFAQDHWTRQQVKAHAQEEAQESAAADGRPSASASEEPSPVYWRTMGLLLAQSDGLLAGYSARLAELGPSPALDRLTKWDFLFLNALGDMDDLLGVVFPDGDDGGDAPDYESAADSGGGSITITSGGRGRRPARTPNPERDASFFFRPEPAVAHSELGRGPESAAAEEEVSRPVPRHGPWDKLTPGQVRSRIAKTGRCSALVKVTPDLSDILMGHVTWWGYASMLRIYKHYHLRLSSVKGMGGDAVDGRMSFSSYPGQVSSADDWYLLGSGLVVTETSLDMYDHNRYNSSYGTGPASLLSWQRVQAANLLAVDGPSWAAVAAAHNSGTYNNQYMIVNLNRFTPGQELQPGLLTIMEIIPGLVVSSDATSDLERGHWPSYNVPYFPEVYEATGYRRHAEALAARGADYAAAAAGLSYQLAPRAKIFRRDAAGANDLASFRRLLRSNAFGTTPTDPLAAASPWDALCGRGDLDPEDPDVYGCFDGKVTNYKRGLALSSDAINGPTTEDGQLPFSWAAHARFRRVPHRGMLDVFDTVWEEQAP